MRIAQIANIVESVPPKKYGGTERVIHTLTEELVRRGHDVTLFASGDSQTSAKLISVYPTSLRLAKLKDVYGSNDYSVLNVVKAYSMQSEFDIIHDHTGNLGLPSAAISRTPVVATLHGPFTTTNRKLYEAVAENINLVAISQGQMKPVPNLPIAGVVYNGLPMENYPFSDTHDGYLLFVGRISPEKGVHHAIDVAQYLQMPLIIAAKLESSHKPDVEYFKQYVEPRLDGDKVKWVGEVNEEERNKLMSKAKCFLHPVIFREPFGLTLVEAMACGCPVVAFGRGSIRELVAQGRTGFVVEDTEEMVEAVANIDVISRAECRTHALENFNEKRMASGYENVYQQILAAHGKLPRVSKASQELLGPETARPLLMS
jgi:glycosyltransferase involved in cell wall biosynthesis